MEEGFPIVVILGLAIFGMIWIGTEAGNIGGENPEEITLYSSNLGTIGETQQDFRTISFGDFTVGETRGNIQAYTADTETIKKGLLSGDNIIINYNATQPGKGQINFEVLGRGEGKGKIYVKVNGNKIFNSATISGAEPEINISRNQFKTGMNKIEIGTSKTGLIGKSSYTLEDIEVTVEDRKFHDYTSYFEIYKHELDNFRPSNLTFQIPVDNSVPTDPLKVEINNQEVYSRDAGRSNQEVTITPGNADLGTGYNTIEFKTNSDAKYAVKNAELQVRYSTNIEPANQDIEFSLDQNQLDYTQRDNTETELSFEYRKTTTATPLKITLNGNTTETTPRNGENTLKLNTENLQTENTLQIESRNTFTLTNLEIVSKKTES
jgi:hypothetical protein